MSSEDEDAQSLHTSGRQNRAPWRVAGAICVLAGCTLLLAAAFRGDGVLRGKVSKNMEEFAMVEKFDCDAALHNFHKAWSVTKKKWCCTIQLKGCEGEGEPKISAGEGMKWEHVQTDGYWSWEVVPVESYDCLAALGNFHLAWSPKKKSWCCFNKHVGCEGDSPPSVSAGEGMAWKRVEVNGAWFWEAVHSSVSAPPFFTSTPSPFDCESALQNHYRAWSPLKKKYCCQEEKKGCEGEAPPSIHAGEGKMWKRVDTDGFKSWQVVDLEFDCYDGGADWSSEQEDWCCKTSDKGCKEPEPTTHAATLAPHVAPVTTPVTAAPVPHGPAYHGVVFTVKEPTYTGACCSHFLGDDCCLIGNEKVCWDSPDKAMDHCCSAKAAGQQGSTWVHGGGKDTVKRFFEERDEEGVPVEMNHFNGELEVQWTKGMIWFGFWDHRCRGYRWTNDITPAQFLAADVENWWYDPLVPDYGQQPPLFVQFEHPFTRNDFTDCLMGAVFQTCGDVKPCHNTTTTTTMNCWMQDLPPQHWEFCCSTFRIYCPTTTVSSTTHTGTTVSTVTYTTMTYTTISQTTLPPPKSCKLWGDPHVITFDESRFVFYRGGDFQILKNDQLNIQGRFEATNWTKANAHTDFSSMTGLIITGPLMNGHKIEVKPLDFEGRIECDGDPILEDFGSSSCGDGVELSYTSKGHLIDDAMAFLPHKVLHIALPRGVFVQCNRWPNFMNAQITIPPGALGEVDGVCGNFNGDKSDDEGPEIHKRFGMGVSEQANLFGTRLPTYIPTSEVPEEKCPDWKRKRSEEICKRELNITSGWDFADCMGNVCVENSIPSEAQGYECEVGDDEFTATMGWSDDKKEWCCKYMKKGCASTNVI